jgi:hypothetical protein
MPTLAIPLALVRAVPEAGTNTPVLSVVVNVKATFGTTLPALSFTKALNDPGRSGDTEVIAAPDESSNDNSREPAAVEVSPEEVPVLVLSATPNLSHKPEILLTQGVVSLPPPQAVRIIANRNTQKLANLTNFVFTNFPL